MNTTYVATTGLETAPLQDGSVLYNLITGKFIMLNRSAAFLWGELATPVTAQELVRRTGLVFSGPQSDAVQQDIGVALAQFRDLELASAKENVAELPARAEVLKVESVEYESPVIRVLDEEELLNIFQMTAAEISVASCWWNACAGSVGCP